MKETGVGNHQLMKGSRMRTRVLVYHIEAIALCTIFVISPSIYWPVHICEQVG